VQYRYSDLEVVNKDLVKGGVPIAAGSFPGKDPVRGVLFGGLSPEFLDRRRQQLNDWVIQLSGKATMETEVFAQYFLGEDREVVPEFTTKKIEEFCVAAFMAKSERGRLSEATLEAAIKDVFHRMGYTVAQPSAPWYKAVYQNFSVGHADGYLDYQDLRNIVVQYVEHHQSEKVARRQCRAASPPAATGPAPPKETPNDFTTACRAWFDQADPRRTGFAGRSALQTNLEAMAAQGGWPTPEATWVAQAFGTLDVQGRGVLDASQFEELVLRYLSYVEERNGSRDNVPNDRPWSPQTGSPAAAPAASAPPRSQDDPAVETVFRDNDRLGMGALTRDGTRAALEGYAAKTRGRKPDVGWIAAMFNTVDLDHDGHIDLKQFKKIVEAYRAAPG